VQSKLLREALTNFAEEAARALQAELEAGAEIPFELASSGGPRGHRSALQLYSPMIGRFLAERWSSLSRLPSHQPAVRALMDFGGLDRYLASLDCRIGLRSPARGALATQALQAFCEDVFREQGDFTLREGRLEAALMRLDAVAADAGYVTLVASLHGLVILSSQLRLAERLTISKPEALSGAAQQAFWQLMPAGARSASAGGGDQLLIVLELPEQDGPIQRTLGHGRQLLRELLRALRLYGDGRIAMGALAWACTDEGSLGPIALGFGGRSQGALVVRAEQEDELRAFCSLLARRTPRDDPAAWALRRFELGCEAASEIVGLTDHLLALQALLEPERVAPGLLASRVAALCAPPQERKQTAARVLRAIELERDAVRGEAAPDAASLDLSHEIANHVRALLRDLICGHLAPDLAALADEMMLLGEEQGGEHPAGGELGEGPTGEGSSGEPGVPAQAAKEPTMRVRRTKRQPSAAEQATEVHPAPAEEPLTGTPTQGALPV
jgi:hypothetical protein